MSKFPRFSRQRGGVAFTEIRSNAWAGLLGFLTGRGYSAPAIAEALGEGTSPDTVRRMWALWGLRSRGLKSREVCIMVPLKERDRAHLTARAAQNGLSIEEYSRRLLICASMPRDRYAEIVPKDQFE